MLMSFIVFTAIWFGIVDSEYADEAAVLPPDKSQYSIFYPTLDNLLRDLASDRPTAFYSPLTLDAELFQMKMDFVNYAYGTNQGVTTENYLAGQVKLAMPLTPCGPP